MPPLPPPPPYSGVVTLGILSLNGLANASDASSPALLSAVASLFMGVSPSQIVSSIDSFTVALTVQTPLGNDTLSSVQSNAAAGLGLPPSRVAVSLVVATQPPTPPSAPSPRRQLLQAAGPASAQSGGRLVRRLTLTDSLLRIEATFSGNETESAASAAALLGGPSAAALLGIAGAQALSPVMSANVTISVILYGSAAFPSNSSSNAVALQTHFGAAAASAGPGGLAAALRSFGVLSSSLAVLLPSQPPSPAPPPVLSAPAAVPQLPPLPPPMISRNYSSPPPLPPPPSAPSATAAAASSVTVTVIAASVAGASAGSFVLGAALCYFMHRAQSKKQPQDTPTTTAKPVRELRSALSAPRFGSGRSGSAPFRVRFASEAEGGTVVGMASSGRIGSEPDALGDWAPRPRRRSALLSIAQAAAPRRRLSLLLSYARENEQSAARPRSRISSVLSFARREDPTLRSAGSQSSRPQAGLPRQSASLGPWARFVRSSSAATEERPVELRIVDPGLERQGSEPTGDGSDSSGEFAVEPLADGPFGAQMSAARQSAAVAAAPPQSSSQRIPRRSLVTFFIGDDLEGEDEGGATGRGTVIYEHPVLRPLARLSNYFYGRQSRISLPGSTYSAGASTASDAAAAANADAQAASDARGLTISAREAAALQLPRPPRNSLVQFFMWSDENSTHGQPAALPPTRSPAARMSAFLDRTLSGGLSSTFFRSGTARTSQTQPAIPEPRISTNALPGQLLTPRGQAAPVAPRPQSAPQAAHSPPPVSLPPVEAGPPPQAGRTRPYGRQARSAGATLSDPAPLAVQGWSHFNPAYGTTDEMGEAASRPQTANSEEDVSNVPQLISLAAAVERASAVSGRHGVAGSLTSGSSELDADYDATPDLWVFNSSGAWVPARQVAELATAAGSARDSDSGSDFYSAAAAGEGSGGAAGGGETVHEETAAEAPPPPPHEPPEHRS